MHDEATITTLLFTDIEGSTRLWEDEPAQMRLALARHDALTRTAIEGHRGRVVKMTGDGVHAVFDDPCDAVAASLALQRALDDTAATGGMALRVRCGVHCGAVQRRDDDFFGSSVNRAARIMAVAHGGQVLLSAAVAEAIDGRLPEGAALRDLGHVRLRDLARPEHVYQLAHPALRQAFPALRSLETTPNNLPEQASSFVGRERELAEVKALLRTTRLLTLLGIGGLGKTRLSLQAGVDAMEHYPDGVWFVELAALTDPRLVPQAVASVLGVKEDAGMSIGEALDRYAQSRCALVILDNCEHLAQACAELAARLLRSGPKLGIVASSREPLHVDGETTYHVPPLSVPDTRGAITAESLVQFESVRLFVDRACAALPAFRVTAQNAAAVVDICRRLDGIPLAIELAAARVRTLPVDRIAERLSDRFRLLTGGSRTALPRQQTLRALIDWSYDLLGEEERALLRRLAVFAGGWTLDAAEAVGVGDGLDAAMILDVLTRLTEKSLVALDAEGGRYRLLDTVRQYAQEKLVETGDGDAARNRHLAFFLDFAAQARPALNGPDQATWLARLDLERENLLAAHAWCDDERTPAESGLRLAEAVQNYWIMRGLMELGNRVTSEALARSAAQARDPLRCRVLFGAGWIGCLMGRYAEARARLEEGLAIARALGDMARVAAMLQPLALAALGLGDPAGARRHTEEALSLARSGGDRRQIAAALNALAQVCRVQGQADEAEPLYEQALGLAREMGDRETTAIELLNLAMIRIDRADPVRARALLIEVFAIARESGSMRIAQSALDVAAGLAGHRAEWHRAAELYGATEELAARTGYRRDPADEAFLAPSVALARATLGDEGFAAAESRGRALASDDALAAATTWLASLP